MRDHRTRVPAVFAMLLLGLHVCSVDGRAKAVLGSLTAARGEVQVDKVVGIPGTTLREGDVIATGSKSRAVISLRSGTKVRVAERTEVALPYDTLNTRLELREGALAVQTGSGQVSQVNTKFATSVLLQSVDGIPALCRVAAIGSEVGVLNDKGRVEIHGAGAPILVPPGKYVLLQAGKPQASIETAGKVIAAIPAEVVERQGAAAIPLHLNDPVYWQDLVKTEMSGRVRIGLTGGSVLNIGARSQMRIVKHDVATEQTELELSVGKLRGQVVKLTKPGAHFQVKTQTAVIGVVGTDLIVISTPQSTTIICLEGTVTVANVLSSISGSVTLQAGQATTVPVNGPPTPATNVSSQTLQTAINQTFLPIVESVTAWQQDLTIGNAVIVGITAGLLGVALDLANQANSSASGALGSLGGGPPPPGCGSIQSYSPYIPYTPICP